MDVQELIRLQVSLEYQLDEKDLLIPFPGSSEQARLLVYRYAAGFTRFYRADLDPELQRKLALHPPQLLFANPQSICQFLGCDGSSLGIRVFVSGIFSRIPSREEFPLANWKDDRWVIEEDGKICAWGWSVRSNPKCAELAVEVLECFRRKGYGRQVAAAWACQVMEAGKTAFYSYETNNMPSKALAKSLGVQVFAECLPFD